MLEAQRQWIDLQLNWKVPVLLKMRKSTRGKLIHFRNQHDLIFRRKTAKSDSKPPTKEEVDTPTVLAKVSVTSDVDEEKEKKKDRELLVK